MTHQRWVFLNGNFYEENNAKISVTDRGFLFGEGVFTTIRVHEGMCEFYQAHLQRLHEQAQILHVSLPSIEFKWIQELIQLNQAEKGTWRLKIVATSQENENKGNFLITLNPYQDTLGEPCSLGIFPHPLESPLAHIKSLAYLDRLYVRAYGKQQGYADAITTTREGFLLETGCANLFWINEQGCWIPDHQLPYLKGILLQKIIEYVKVPTHFVQMTLDQLMPGSSLYMCNALMHIRPVIAIENQSYPRNLMWEASLKQAIKQALKDDEERKIFDYK